jgi:hypothetical protein
MHVVMVLYPPLFLFLKCDRNNCYPIQRDRFLYKERARVER